MKFNNLNDPFLDKINEFKQKPEDINLGIFKIIPDGSNNDTSLLLYYERKNYHKALNLKLDSIEVDKDSFKDFVYKHGLYGKVNFDNFSLTPKEKLLKQLDLDKKITLINSAADAFNDFSKKHASIVNQKLIFPKSKFYDIKPKAGYVSPHIEYSKYLNVYFNEFFKYLKSNNLKKNITDFPSTIKQFISFYNSSKERKILNKSEFIKSNLCTPFVSGLIVEISQDEVGEDKNIYENYINDEYFGAFQNLVKEYGFTLDKHAPWKMIFDLSTETANPYLQKYDINNTKSFLTKNYYLCEYFDYDSFIANMFNLYIFIISEERSFKTLKLNVKDNNICISQKTITRQSIKFQDISKYITEVELMKVFFYLKCIETNSLISENKFEQDFEQISAILKFKDKYSALEMMFEKCNINREMGNPNIKMHVL